MACSSSALMVALVAARRRFLENEAWLDPHKLAAEAYEVERERLGIKGGMQDQYAAVFGGFNFMEFYNNDKVIVNPLRIKQHYLNELEFSIVLYYTGVSRLSSKIIEAQSKNVIQKKEESIHAMDKLKEQALMMKEAILKGDFGEIGEILDFGWKFKKQMAEGISNSQIEEIYEAAMKAGATGGKLSGAGGGGFMIFYCPGNTRYSVMESVKRFGGEFKPFNFTENGLTTWSV